MRDELTVPVNATDHIRGAEHAPVTLIEYGDFQCPHCLAAEPAVRALLERFDERVRLVYRHFPLEQVHGDAMRAAQAAEAAGAQGRFWQMHDLLFAHQSHLDFDHLRRYAETIGLDMARFIAEMDDEIYLQRVREHQAGGQASGVDGTPGFFINGRAWRGGEQGSLVDRIESALHAARPPRG
jgi:protein-disulfide isomerase